MRRGVGRAPCLRARVLRVSDAQRLGLSGGVSKLVTPDWRLFGFVRVDDVRAGKNRDSPLVLRNTGASVGFGAAYTWLRSAARANE